MPECTRLLKNLGHSYEAVFDETEKFPENLNIETIMEQINSHWDFDSYDIAKVIESMKEHSDIYVGSVCKYCGDFLPRQVEEKK
jgi:hypothetical protein